jgi:hypothetical protein
LMFQLAALKTANGGCQAGAEQFLQIVSRIQTKVEKIEDEVVRLKSDIRTVMAKAIRELRNEFDSQITVCETRFTDHQQGAQKSIESKLAVIENKMKNDFVPGIVDTCSKSSWMDAVSKEVESKINEVTAYVTVLKQQVVEIQMDKDEQAEIIKRKNCVIIHGLKESEGDSGEERKRNDENRIMDMLHQIRCDEISILNFVSLGRKQVDSNVKARPIKLVTSEYLWAS